jgi:hypothetical protein
VAHTYHELKTKTLQELRDIAKSLEHEAVRGSSQMNKEHLLPALCKALGIDTHEHAEVVGIDKPSVKSAMRSLKAQIAQALQSGDHAKARALRRQRHTLNHQIRSHVAHSS